MSGGFILRPGRARDARAMAGILAGWIAETPWFTNSAPHSASRDAMAGHLLRAQVVVAEARGLRRQVLGFGVREAGQLAAFYVLAKARGQGIGRAMLDELRKTWPGDLYFASFAANTAALGFYRAMGCETLGQSAGDNEEGLPDVRLVLRTEGKRMAHG